MLTVPFLLVNRVIRKVSPLSNRYLSETFRKNAKNNCGINYLSEGLSGVFPIITKHTL